MVVALGRSIQNPLYTLFQIVNAVSLFFVILGATRLLICFLTLDEGSCPNVSAVGNGDMKKRISPIAPFAKDTHPDEVNVEPSCVPPSEFLEVWMACLRISPSSLFKDPFIPGNDPIRHSEQPRVEISFFKFLLMQILTCLFMAYPLSLLLQRRKLVFDFMLTIYGVYLLLADIALRRVMGGGLYWWLSVLCGMVVLYGSTWWICRRRELQEIPVGLANTEMTMISPSNRASSQKCFRGGGISNHIKDKSNNISQTTDIFIAHNENSSAGGTVAIAISDSRCKDE